MCVVARKSKNVVTLEVDSIIASPGLGEPGFSATDTSHPLYIGGVPGWCNWKLFFLFLLLFHGLVVIILVSFFFDKFLLFLANTTNFNTKSFSMMLKLNS